MISRLEKAKKQILKIPYLITESGCYIPTNRTKNRNGRINTTFEGKQMNLSRLAAFVYLGLNINNVNELALHKLECSDKACFNYLHLYVGNQSQNTNDSVKMNTHPESSREFCPLGHKYDGIVRVYGKITGRYCKKCKRDNARARRK